MPARASKRKRQRPICAVEWVIRWVRAVVLISVLDHVASEGDISLDERRFSAFGVGVARSGGFIGRTTASAARSGAHGIFSGSRR